MLSPKPLKNIQARFVFLTTAILAIVCLLILSLAIWHGQNTHQDEIKKVLTEQTLSTLASHTQERKQQDYLTLQRILPRGDWVESVALYDKDCNILTTTFLPTFPINRCPRGDWKTIRIQYSDVLSPIGTIILKLNVKALNPSHVLFWLPIVFSVFLLVGILISVCWKFFIYQPLTKEINSLASGDVTSIDELGPLGEKIGTMINQVKTHELQKERLIVAEQKFQNALKVAHDILAPLQVIKSEIDQIELSPRSRKSLLQIEGIAFDLLPEKAPIELSPSSLNDILKQSIENARIGIEQSLDPLIEGPQNLSIYVSPLHIIRSLTNLLRNGFEVQPNGTPLRIKIEVAPSSEVSINIIDNGPGIDLNFKSIESSKAQGSGLGIKSAKDAIDKMGGRLEFVSSTAGTIVKVYLRAAKKIIYTIPGEKIYRFGLDAKDNLNDLSSLAETKNRVLVLSPFTRPSQVGKYVRWVQVQNSNEVQIIEMSSALLIDDDKYVRANWTKEAHIAGLDIQVSPDLPDELNNVDMVFLDRYLGSIDTINWQKKFSAEGHRIVMISAEIGSSSKTPPWLLS